MKLTHQQARQALEMRQRRWTLAQSAKCWAPPKKEVAAADKPAAPTAGKAVLPLSMAQGWAGNLLSAPVLPGEMTMKGAGI